MFPLQHLTHSVIHYENDNRTFIGSTHTDTLQGCNTYLTEALDAGYTGRIEIVPHLEASARKVAKEIDEGAYTLDWFLNGLGRKNTIIPIERECALYGWDRQQFETSIRSYLGGKYNIH